MDILFESFQTFYVAPCSTSKWGYLAISKLGGPQHDWVSLVVSLKPGIGGQAQNDMFPLELAPLDLHFLQGNKASFE